ncbi:hypothetical protein [Deinococcus sp. DB0503]|uniref:hypothetical protein n=1 Tax=Deinococcus sp. DB0503 TaxID=2479203 RepID=UPI0018E01D70|nr:hypothetical protein [Deinococcus sp. DB0503]
MHHLVQQLFEVNAQVFDISAAPRMGQGDAQIFQNAALSEQQHAVHEFQSFFEVMRDEEGGGASIGQERVEQRMHVCPGEGVQRTEGFVKKQQIWAVGQSVLAKLKVMDLLSLSGVVGC